ncbi:unnamed protein product [Owenia fusiformis]|uniref:RNA helicase n=1 Tax=Owenia fusiformis TaxID=6347 RepID=A0A8J1TUL3_OWEFU|nr:unnamed protein product [Owenia fusiformis]
MGTLAESNFSNPLSVRALTNMAANRQQFTVGPRNHQYMHPSGVQVTPTSRVSNMQRPNSASPRPSSVGSSSSGGKGKGLRHDICVGEEVKIAVDIAMEKFRIDETQKELEFPSSLTSTERAYIHRLCQTLGLKSKSRGKGNNRYLTVGKKEGNQTLKASSLFSLMKNSRQQINSLLQRFPVTNKERQELQPRTDKGHYSEMLVRDMNKTTTGRLNNGVPQVPPHRGDSELLSFRQTLPVSQMGPEIINAVSKNQVVLVSGETGSGKTTQVPQIIMDECTRTNKPCRIFCTQPRRISALSVAERVAAERGEKIGQTVGYQIRLESRVSPKTLLTFCTNGVLLRTLMGGATPLSAVTHIIVDEIHERDRFSDFLLILLRHAITQGKYRNLKVILMSAALNIDLFSAYFDNCPVINVPGKVFHVEEYFLEDLLKMTNYTNKEMEKYRQEIGQVEKQQQELNDWCNKAVPTHSNKHEEDDGIVLEELDINDSGSERSLDMSLDKEELEPWLVKEMDQLLSDTWLTGDEELFTQIFHLIMSENVNVDYIHAETSATPLMIAAGRGFFSIVEQLLNLGANSSIRASNDWMAVDWAKRFEHTEVVDLLEAHMAATEQSKDDETMLIKSAETISQEDRDLLKIYHHCFDDEKVDLDLIMAILHQIYTSNTEGAVLIFLPGYDEIVTLRDMILADEDRFPDNSKYILYTLHSSMQSSDQRKVFKTVPPGVRKIIMSTNIAETSITINDVVFVIDSGKVKEKSYDAIQGVSTLKSTWVSKASALQRKGRAGRCRAGKCYHLFSRVRWDSMMQYQEPEILRYPLQELCLHTKLLAPMNMPIADFLAKAPQPPAFISCRNAVTLLKQIDALDNFEDLTEIGHHLTDLPIEPRYGKMVLYSVVLKCLDPILTIACALAYRDPFTLPAHPSQKRAAAQVRRRFSAGTNSDHMALLRAFQSWQKARADGWERSFCEKNYLSSATMEMIVGMRTQLLGQLRASGFVRARGGGDIRDLNTNSENWAVVKAALCAGSYPNILMVDRERWQIMTQKESKVRFHPTSVLSAAPDSGKRLKTHGQLVNALPTDWLLYEELSRSHRIAQVRIASVLSPLTLALMAGPCKLSEDNVKEAESMESHAHSHMGQGDIMEEHSSDSEGEEKDEVRKSLFRVDEWIAFKVDSEAANMVMQLRLKWHSLFLRRMRAPSKPWSQPDENVVRAVINCLTNEEQGLGLQQPAGIGQRPRPMSEAIMSSGSRQSSFDVDQSEESQGGRKSNKGVGTPPRQFRREFINRGKYSDDRQYHSAPTSGASSAENSRPSSLRGSAQSSPCPSPKTSSPSSPSKWGLERDPGATSSHPCRYFVMKSNNHKNLDISYQKRIWATTASNERKLNKAFKDGKTVYLIFSVQGSGHFQGFAKMTSLIGKEKSPDFGAPGLGGCFGIDWVKKANLQFQSAHHLLNPWNENKKVQVSRDGQEIEPQVGGELCKLWDKLPNFQPKQQSPQASKPVNIMKSPPSSQGQSKQGSEVKSKPVEVKSQTSQEATHNEQSKVSTKPQNVHKQWNQGQGQRYYQGHSQGRGGYGSPHMNPYGPLYVNPMMGQSPMVQQGSPNMSPGQNMSPVMILPRGAQPPTHHNTGHHGNHPGSNYGGYHGNYQQ